MGLRKRQKELDRELELKLDGGSWILEFLFSLHIWRKVVVYLHKYYVWLIIPGSVWCHSWMADQSWRGFKIWKGKFQRSYLVGWGHWALSLIMFPHSTCSAGVLGVANLMAVAMTNMDLIHLSRSGFPLLTFSKECL